MVYKHYKVTYFLEAEVSIETESQVFNQTGTAIRSYSWRWRNPAAKSEGDSQLS